MRKELVVELFNRMGYSNVSEEKWLSRMKNDDGKQQSYILIE